MKPNTQNTHRRNDCRNEGIVSVITGAALLIPAAVIAVPAAIILVGKVYTIMGLYNIITSKKK